jgi:hypothetical protein
MFRLGGQTPGFSNGNSNAAAAGGGDAASTTTTSGTNGGVASTDSQGGSSSSATPGNEGRTVKDIIADVQNRLDANNGRGTSATAKSDEGVVTGKTDTGQEAKKTTQEGSAEGVGEGQQDEVELPDGQKLKIDGAAKAREWGEKWRKSAEAWKPMADFVNENFSGDLEAAKMAVDFFNLVSGEEFKPDAFLSQLKNLSPSRVDALQKFMADSVKGTAKEAALKELFGEKVTPEEVESFRKFQQAGGNLALFGDPNDADIPEGLKFDKDGNKKSDEEINYLKGLKKDLVRQATEIQSIRQQQQQEAMLKEQNELGQQVEKYVESRTAIIGQLADEFGLKPVPGEKPEITQKKESLRSILYYAAMGLFGENENAVADYQNAIKHLSNREGLLASKYNRRIEGHLLNSASKVAELLGDVLRIQAEGVVEQHAQATTGRTEVSGGSSSGSSSTTQGKRLTFSDKVGMQAQWEDIKSRYPDKFPQG